MRKPLLAGNFYSASTAFQLPVCQVVASLLTIGGRDLFKYPGVYIICIYTV